MSHHVSASAVWDGEQQRLHLADQAITNAAVRRKFKPGDGESFVVLVMRPEDSITWGDFKHLYGHLYAPVSRRTGETVAEVHVRMKAAFMPDDGRTSITELSRAEMKAFTESVEQDIRENDPDSWEDCVAAMALFEQGHRRRA